MFSQEAIQKILGIEGAIDLNSREMAKKLNITLFPYNPDEIGSNVLKFKDNLFSAFKKLNVNIVPYENVFETVPFKKRIWIVALLFLYYLSFCFKKIFKLEEGKNYISFSVFLNIIKKRKIKKNIVIIALGENQAGKLPVDKIRGFKNNSIVTIIDKPDNIKKDSDFHQHFDKMMGLFAYHMANIIILVNSKCWVLYNLNASHPIYDIDKDFEKHVLDALVPKLAAPIKPVKFSEFAISQKKFDITKKPLKKIVEDFIRSGLLLQQTGLYPPGKTIDSLPFRNKFYRWIGDMFLDHRSGMSYGFLASQLPTELTKLIPIEKAKGAAGDYLRRGKDYFVYKKNIYLMIHLPTGRFCLRVPKVWVLSQRSGSHKMGINPNKDLIKLGLINGKMIMEAPIGSRLTGDYKPSFDTRVLLAHAVGNAIIASILANIKPEAVFSQRLKKRGISLSHWHGYFNKKSIPAGWYVYGENNLHVSCSSPQSAIYAVDGKMKVFIDSLYNSKLDYQGDIHIEPHHGTIMSFSSLQELGRLLNYKKSIVSLGNHYLDSYSQ